MSYATIGAVVVTRSAIAPRFVPGFGSVQPDAFGSVSAAGFGHFVPCMPPALSRKNTIATLPGWICAPTGLNVRFVPVPCGRYAYFVRSIVLPAASPEILIGAFHVFATKSAKHPFPN